eukprot:scaffold2590_cov94-Isochrysis_galbana.AAC.2
MCCCLGLVSLSKRKLARCAQSSSPQSRFSRRSAVASRAQVIPPGASNMAAPSTRQKWRGLALPRQRARAPLWRLRLRAAGGGHPATEGLCFFP